MGHNVVLMVALPIIQYLWNWVPSKPNNDIIHVKINVISRRVVNNHFILIVNHKMTTGNEMPHVTFAVKRAILNLTVVHFKLN